MHTYGMPRFDLELWRSRAFERDRRRPRGRLWHELAMISAISRVVEWCGRSRIDVSFDGSTGGTSHDDRIVVNARLAPERQLHVLLHECGHWSLRRRKADWRRFRRGYGESDPAHLRTMAHRVDVLHEELEAWYEGLRIADAAKVQVDLDRYNLTRSEYVRGYLKWALRAPGYEGGLEDEPKPERRKAPA